jgi:putative nucleotidyltransferase with HDIG domain
MSIADIEKVIERMESTKILKNVALRIFQLSSDPNTTASDISNLVEKDDYLAAVILKVANSSYFGNGGKIKSIPDAIVLLGFTGIKSIAVAASLVARSDDENISKSEIVIRERLWRHSISTAIAAKFIAEKIGFKDLGQAYITGIIHDIGKLGIYQYDEKAFARIEAFSRDRSVQLIDAELSILGFDHAQIGALILSKWSFPESIIQTVMYHHRFFDDVNNRDLVGIITLANFISNSLGFGSENVKELDPKIMKLLNLDYDTIKSYVQEISGILSHVDILKLGI